MRRNFIPAGIMVLLVSISAAATVIDIPDDYPTIQQGINSSTDGDTVLVQPGTYVENINFNGHNIALGSLFLTTGDTSYISQTIIDGDSAGSVVTFDSGEDSTAVIIAFTLRNGYALYGGGIICSSNSNPKICNNAITGNSPFFGGGIHSYNSEPTIYNNVIHNNSASLYGGGIYLYYSNAIISNNVLSRNIAGQLGGGCCIIRSSPIITNLVSWADTAGTDGNEIFVNLGSPTISYSNIQGGWEGEGNIDIDPLFRDPENGDFHLSSDSCGYIVDSPCIDAGDPDIYDSRYGCEWGLGELRNDMGAYGGGDSPTVGIDDYPDEPPRSFMLFQNYPNPLNTSTTIRFRLPEKSRIRVEVYNILGQLVATLFDGIKDTGYHRTTWQADNCSSGVYFARLEANNSTKNVRMLLTK